MTASAQNSKAANGASSTNAMPDASERLMAEIAADTLKAIANLMGRIEKLEHANMVLREHYLTLVQTNSQLRVRLMNLEGYAAQMINRAKELGKEFGEAVGFMHGRFDEIKSFLNGMCNSHD